MFKRDKKRASVAAVECPSGRSGTLQTACQGKSPAESGTVLRTISSDGPHKSVALVDAVESVSASSDTETGTSHLSK
ncbi:hypothetical protein [Haladaptatus sp. NG-SE-30]